MSSRIAARHRCPLVDCLSVLPSVSHELRRREIFRRGVRGLRRRACTTAQSPMLRSVARKLLVLVAVVVLACRREPQVAREVPSSELRKTVDAAVPPSPTPSPTPTPSVIVKRREPLAPPPPGWSGIPDTVVVWPSGVCSDGVGLVVSHCGCGAKTLLCSALVTPSGLDLEVHTDGTGSTTCTACTWWEARCLLPPLPVGQARVRIHGSFAFDADVDASGRVESGTCWGEPGA